MRRRIPLFVGFYIVPRTVSVQIFEYIYLAFMLHLLFVCMIISFYLSYRKKSALWFTGGIVLLGALLTMLMVNGFISEDPIVRY